MKKIVVVTVAAVLGLGGVAGANPGVPPDSELPINYGETFAAPSETSSGKYFPGTGGVGTFASAVFGITTSASQNDAGLTLLRVLGANGDFVELSANIDAPDVIDRRVELQRLVQKGDVTVLVRVGPVASPPEPIGIEGCNAKAKTKVLDEESQDYVKGIFVVSCPQAALEFAPLNATEREQLGEILGTRFDGTGFLAKVKMKRAVPEGPANPLIP